MIWQHLKAPQQSKGGAEMTTKTQHTPGPWMYGEEKPPGCLMVATTMGVDIYAAPDAEGQLGTSEADARLIAAAPDLLEACKAMLNQLETMTSEDFARGAERTEREKLRAAIAKARGENS